MVAVNVVDKPTSDGLGSALAVCKVKGGLTTMDLPGEVLFVAFESVTVTAMLKVPVEAYVCVAGLPVTLGDPSPKLQPNVYGGVPPPAVAVKVTGCPTTGLVGE